MNAQVRPLPAARAELCHALRMLAIDAVEAAKSGHHPAVVSDPDFVGIDRFGESAPASPVAAALGLTAEAVGTHARALLRRRRGS